MTQVFPQLADQIEIRSLTAYFDDPEWVFEQKLDGHRIHLNSPPDPGPPAAFTRGGSLYSRGMPREIQDFRFPQGEFVLDGELMGRTLWLFDMPVFPGSRPDMPLYQRRAALEALLANVPHPFRLVPQARTRDEKIALADKALRSNFEGLVLKKRSSIYKSGMRTVDWLKLKFTASCDVVVSDVRSDGKDSVGYMVFDETDGTAIDLGRASLIGKEKKAAIAVGDVLEVRYLYVGANGRLYQPTILRKRTDKQPIECTNRQLKYVNKAVLETL